MVSRKIEIASVSVPGAAADRSGVETRLMGIGVLRECVQEELRGQRRE